MKPKHVASLQVVNEEEAAYLPPKEPAQMPALEIALSSGQPLSEAQEELNSNNLAKLYLKHSKSPRLISKLKALGNISADVGTLAWAKAKERLETGWKYNNTELTILAGVASTHANKNLSIAEGMEEPEWGTMEEELHT